MAPFNARPQTHRQVLPQPAALESVSADNPGQDETAHGHPATGRVPGVGHWRGEPRRRAPDGGRHPGAASAASGVPGREAHPSAFVLDRRGRALQPCHPARARKLLAARRAVVHRHTPFVIRLRDRTVAGSTVTGVQLGIDPGSKHTGIAVFHAQDEARHGLFAVQLDHRGARIRDRMTARANYRRRRRSANLRYRAPRFLNRHRPSGWLPPSLRHRVDTTMSWVNRLRRWAPVTAIHVERAVFDTHALSAGRSLNGVEYQHGTLHGFEIREYLLAKWKRCCAYCGARGVPLNVDHIRPRARGGTDRVSNLALACIPCNQDKSSLPVELFLAGKPDRLAKILAQAKAPLRDAAVMNATRRSLWRALTPTGLTVHVASGGRTRWNRSRSGAPKSHTLDALHVGALAKVTGWPDRTLVAVCAERGVYQRTTPDQYGFPRLSRPRVKRMFGLQTGDLVRASVPSGKRQGVHTGRVLVRGSGRFDIITGHGRAAGINHRHVRLLQRADGYAYTTRQQERCRSH